MSLAFRPFLRRRRLRRDGAMDPPCARSQPVLRARASRRALRQIRQPFGPRRAEFAQVAGKFIGSGQVLEFAAAGENVETELGEGVEKLVKSSANQGRGLFR